MANRLAGPIVDPGCREYPLDEVLGLDAHRRRHVLRCLAAHPAHRGLGKPQGSARSSLKRIGRPFGRVADWVERHPRTIQVIVALLGILYAAAAWMALRAKRHFMGVLVILNGIWLGLSLLSMRRMLRTSTHARRGRPRQGPRHGEERRER